MKILLPFFDQISNFIHKDFRPIVDKIEAKDKQIWKKEKKQISISRYVTLDKPLKGAVDTFINTFLLLPFPKTLFVKSLNDRALFVI